MFSSMVEMASAHFGIRVGDPFVVCKAGDARVPGRHTVHPLLIRLTPQRLILTVNRDGDIYDAEHVILTSVDDGRTWEPAASWPTSAVAGEHLATTHAALDDGSSLVTGRQLFATETPGIYALPSWRTSDGGESWSEMTPAPVTLPFTESRDIYDPADDFRRTRDAEWLTRWIKPRPPVALSALFDQLGPRRLPSWLVLYPLAGTHLLAFVYLTPHLGGPHLTVCIASDDAGQTWHYRSTPGPFDERYRTENFLSHGVDGLCEPSATHLANGDLLLVMRLGSRHPMYAVKSSDEGHTWDRPRPLSIHGILPTVLTLPGGTIALASGRPDVTLSFSFDDGYRWPMTFRFLEDGKPEDPSTRNNTLLQISPNRLLYMYDYGYHPTPPGVDVEHRIEARFIDVATDRADGTDGTPDAPPCHTHDASRTQS